MLYQISDGTVSLGGQLILSHIEFEIKGTEKIAVVGKNGAGKSTLLKLIEGSISLDRDDKRGGAGIYSSRKLTVEMLGQLVFSGAETMTVEELLLKACPGEDMFSRERFEYEREFDILFTGMRFSKEDKKRKITEFSGGEQTKIELIRLLLKKPDVLLLDEPTNHLDMETVQWLEQYMKAYPYAVVMVSHDRFFLDETADIVYELSGNKLVRYVGNYSEYRRQKKKNLESIQKAYVRQQQEKKRLEDLIERFKHKPNKAAFARSKRKVIERMEILPKPETDDIPLFTGDIRPDVLGSKWVFEAEHLKVGYEKPLFELSLRIKRGQKIGILGINGSGKTTLLKTVAGFLKALDGDCSLGVNITMGYFDQHSAGIESDKTVVGHFHDLFPSLTEKELRSILGAYLFGGREAGKIVSSLSGGERSRLVLAELLQSRPNFLVLDEPTNHMDIQAKETLESAFKAYTGTMLFVSHDRYFISQVADAVLILDGQSVFYYPFGYRHYINRTAAIKNTGDLAGQMKAEEQALIAGIRAVPKAERFRLREQPEEEAYLDWQLRLHGEQLDAARIRVEKIWAQMEAMQSQWFESEACWKGEEWPLKAEFERLGISYEESLAGWTEQCLLWSEQYPFE